MEKEPFNPKMTKKGFSRHSNSEPAKQLREVVERLKTAVEKRSGTQLWYSCGICNRTVRTGMEEKHDQEYHFTVHSDSCKGSEDLSEFSGHEDKCPSQCSGKTTFAEVDSDSEYAVSTEARRPTSTRSLEGARSLESFCENASAFHDVLELASKLSLNEDDHDLACPANLIRECRKVFRPQAFSVVRVRGMSARTEAEKEELRACQEKKGLGTFLTKEPSETEVDCVERYRDKRLEEEIDAQMVKVAQNPWNPMRRQYLAKLQSMNLKPAMKQRLTIDQRSHFVRDLHKLEAKRTRYAARKWSRRKMEKDFERICKEFCRDLRMSDSETKEFMSEHSEFLKNHKDKLPYIPQEDWLSLIHDVKDDRPGLSELGFRIKDCDYFVTDTSTTGEFIEKLEALIRSGPEKPSFIIPNAKEQDSRHVVSR